MNYRSARVIGETPCQNSPTKETSSISRARRGTNAFPCNQEQREKHKIRPCPGNPHERYNLCNLIPECSPRISNLQTNSVDNEFPVPDRIAGNPKKHRGKY